MAHHRLLTVMLSGAVFFVLTDIGAAGDDASSVASAREVLALWSNGKYEELHARCAEKMRQAVDAEGLAKAWKGMEAQFGRMVREESAELVAGAQMTSVRLVVRFERATVKLRFVLDETGRMAGMQVEAADKFDTGDPPPYAEKNALREEPFELSSGGFKLPGVLTLPARTDGPVAAIVLVHGSGPHDMDETVGPNKPFRDLAWGLATKGVASFRYEKRTYKHGGAIKPELVTLDWETIEDARAAVVLVQQRKEIDPKRVFVLGHSLGGWAAPLIAERTPGLAGVVLMAANARPLVELIEDQLVFIAGLGGKEGEQATKDLDRLRPSLAAVRAGKPEQAGELIFGAPGVYWAALSRDDAVTVATQLTIPVLVLHGGRDYQVTDKDLRIWQSRLGQRSNVTFKVHARANHLMIAGDGAAGPADDMKAGHLDEAVIDDIAAWMKK